VAPRLRQVVLAARDLEATVAALHDELPLGEPFNDPAIAYFGLRNAVFALGDTFLEVVSPVREDAAAARLIERRGGDCGYMLMFQVEDYAGARERARAYGIREVFEVALPDMEEVHLHPADMRGAIVSLSHPQPPASWRWGGPRWEERSAPLRLDRVRVAVADADAVGERWRDVLGGDAGVRFEASETDAGPVQLTVATTGPSRPHPFQLAGIQFAFVPAAPPPAPSR
jgi:Glyoxalase-like domain